MDSFPPISPMLTDFYQITIARAQWEQGRQDEPTVFDLFYRVQPFKGSFAVFAGLNEAIKFIKNYKFSEDDLEYIQQNLPGVDAGFIDYLRHIDMSKVRIIAPKEGSIVFPREPLMRLEGPLALCQLVETPLLNCINFATLMATNAARMRLLTENKTLMEFGLRRAQGPDGAISASRYSYLGGFDSTSNVLAGKRFGIPIAGTVAHSFVTSYSSVEQLKTKILKHKETEEVVDMLKAAREYLEMEGKHTNEGELISFIAQAITYPENFLALVDTFDSIHSGVVNFLAVSYALHKAGYKGKGIRLDSGDLADLSKRARKMFIEFEEKYNVPGAGKFIITASNDINEELLLNFIEVGHEMDSFGIGTHLVTCQKQPALGGVYKLVEIDGIPKVKLSDEVVKSTLPGKKEVYRLFDSRGEICDVIALEDEVLDGHEVKVMQVWPTGGYELETVQFDRAQKFYSPCWENGIDTVDSLHEARDRCVHNLKNFNRDVMRITDFKYYKVAISEKMNNLLNKLVAEAHSQSD